MALDRIHIRHILARCIIGVNGWERRQRQDVVIDVTLFADLAAAGRSDDIADTVNYRSVNKRIVESVERSRFHLIERLAESVVEICLAFDGVREVEVTVDKPGALRFARSVAVTIRRSRDGA